MNPESVTVRDVEWRAAPGGMETVVSIGLEHPLSARASAEIEAEIREAIGAKVPGMVALRAGDVGPDGVRLALEAVPDDALRLDALFACFRARGFPFGQAIAVFLVDRLGRTIAALHRTRSPTRGHRLLGSLDPSTVVLNGQGVPEILAFGLPRLDQLLASCRGASHALRHRPPPEARGGAGVDARAAVYGLGVLYYQLLSGRPFGEAILTQEGLSDAPLPGSLPDPRPTLIQLLECALSEEPEHRFSTVEGFLQAMHRESGDVSRLDAQILLARLIFDVAGEPTPRGPRTLLALGTDAPAPLRGASGGGSAGRGEILVFEPATGAASSPAMGMTPPPVMGPGPASPAPPQRAEPALRLPLPGPPPRGRTRREELPAFEMPTPIERAGSLERGPPPERGVSFERGGLRRARSAEPRSHVWVAGAAILVTLAGSGLIYRRLKESELVAPTAAFEAATGEAAPLDPGCSAEANSADPTSCRSATLRAPLAPGCSAEANSADPTSCRSATLRAPPAPGCSAEANSADPTSCRSATARAPLAPGLGADAPRAAAPPDSPQKGLLSIMSHPLGATIEVDGGYVGKTPFVMSHTFDRPSYRVRLSLERHVTWEQTVDFDPENRRLNVMATLEPASP